MCWDIYACLLGDIRLISRSWLELVSLDLYVNLGFLLTFGVLQKEVQIGLNLWIRSGLDFIWSHFLLVFIEIGQLFLHILIFYPFFLLSYVSLFLIFYVLGSELLLFKKRLILLNWLILFRLTIFRLHFNYLRHRIKCSPTSPELGLIFYPLEGVNNAGFLFKIDLFDHTCPLLHFEQF